MNLNRRDFLKGGALIGGTAALGTMFGCAASPKGSTSGAVSTDAGLPAGTAAEDFAQSSVSLDPITAFSEEKTYDIVVVGAGTAGVPAVYSALEEGATVACLQREGTVQANGNGSSGIILEESNEAGILQYMQAWRKAGGYRMNPDLLKLFVDHSGETHMWMLQRSAEVDYIPSPISATKTTYDEGNFCTAVIKTYGPKPKNHTDIMALLAAAAEKQGAEFFYSTPAVQLVKDESGAITGVIGKSENDYIKFSATKAVILAAGDYQNNESMVERYSPDVVRFGRKQMNRTGDGILLGMTAGGAMSPVNHAKTMHDMDAAPMLMTRIPLMALDEKGERFMNEEIPMESWDLTLNTRKDVEDPGRFFRIFDSDYMVKYGSKTSIESLENYIPGFKESPENVYPSLVDTHRADTLDELAEQLGIPADALKKSVEKWNEACASGVDNEFGVLKENLHPIDTPPYWGIRQWIRCSAINSGVMVNGNCQVLDAQGNVIKGLYSVGSGAGNLCGGLEWNLAQGGLCCGSYMTMGRYAAIHAITGKMEPSKPATYEDTKSYWAK